MAVRWPWKLARDYVLITKNPLILVGSAHMEEADARIMLHLKDVAMEGNSNVSIYKVDTDVLVLAIKAVECLGITNGCI